MLRKIECFLMPSKLDPMRDMLIRKGVEGMSISEVRGFGKSSKVKDGVPQFEERVKVEIVVHENEVEEILRAIRDLAGLGEIGAGKVFVIPVEDALRLSTREHGRSAIF
ncbi:MAG: P-II family nitrogen regulator [Planctomycetota bacterium]